VYLGLLVLPDVVLGLFAPVYAVALVPLLWLVGGQAIQTACAPTMRLIPMSGHATLNLVNGLVALALNVALNAWWIPSYGAVGAAMATGVTLAAWSLWRVVEVKWLLGCFPFDRRSGVLLAMTTATGLSAAWLGEGQHLLLRIGLLGLAVLVLVGTVALVCRTDADRALVSRVGRRMQRLVGSGRR
jgi:O-antigen/teichoic acid export membrane protein